MTYGKYAGSDKSLKEFKKRFIEISSNPGVVNNIIAYGDYAGSNNNLKIFKQKYNNIRTDWQKWCMIEESGESELESDFELDYTDTDNSIVLPREGNLFSK